MLQFLALNPAEIHEAKATFASASELTGETLRGMLVHNINALLFKSLTLL